MAAGAVEASRRQRVDLAVDSGNTLFQHVQQIERSDIPRIEFGDDGVCRFAYQGLVSHQRLQFLLSYGNRIQYTHLTHHPAK